MTVAPGDREPQRIGCVPMEDRWRSINDGRAEDRTTLSANSNSDRFGDRRSSERRFEGTNRKKQSATTSGCRRGLKKGSATCRWMERAVSMLNDAS